MHEAVAANSVECALALLEHNPRTINSFFGSKTASSSSLSVGLLAVDSEHGFRVMPLHEPVAANSTHLIAAVLDYVAKHQGRCSATRHVLVCVSPASKPH